MGVPGFFAWLVQRCPDLLSSMKPGEADCLYIDANAPVHTCSHSDPLDLPKDEDEIFQRFMEYLDHLIKEVRPRKLLYIGMDGVAPRAKMNQQRARRFMSIKESEARKKVEAKIRERWTAAGLAVPDEVEHWDHNVITPGTPFMDRLSQFVRHFVATKVQNDPLWKNLIVFFSDSNEPSEGEHKILQFIKRQRQAPGYDPNTTHYILGPDADLIQLSICTHEPHLYIVREVAPKDEQHNGGGWICNNCKYYHRRIQAACFRCSSIRIPEEESSNAEKGCSWRPMLKILSIPLVRAYFDFCLNPILEDNTLPPEMRDRERLYDDLILLFCFIGNDFLPHLPSMRIQQNALGRCLVLYTQIFKSMGGYLTHQGEIDLSRLQQLLDSLVDEFKERDPATNRFLNQNPGGFARTFNNAIMQAQWCSTEQQQKLFNALVSLAMEQRTVDEMSEFVRSETIKIGTNGWQERYLQQKFGLDPTTPKYAKRYENLRAKLSRDYLLGLVWVVRYYYHQCRSWSWYFPHHFSPPLSLISTNDLKSTDLDLSGPLRPFEQLLCVMPLKSAQKTVPEELYNVVSASGGPLLKYYPTEFEVDLHNCPPSWMSVVILPFVEEEQLLGQVRPVEDALEDKAAIHRNSWRPGICICHHDHPLAARLMRAMASVQDRKARVHKNLVQQSANLPVSGKFILSPKLNPPQLPSPSCLLPDIPAPQVFLCEYLVADGGFTGHFTHNSNLIDGAQPPVVEMVDMVHPLEDPRKLRARKRGWEDKSKDGEPSNNKRHVVENANGNAQADRQTYKWNGNYKSWNDTAHTKESADAQEPKTSELPESWDVPAAVGDDDKDATVDVSGQGERNVVVREKVKKNKKATKTKTAKADDSKHLVEETAILTRECEMQLEKEKKKKKKANLAEVDGVSLVQSISVSTVTVTVEQKHKEKKKDKAKKEKKSSKLVHE